MIRHTFLSIILSLVAVAGLQGQENTDNPDPVKAAELDKENLPTAVRIWQTPYPQGIAAQVEDRIITYEEMRREMAPLLGRIRKESRTEEEFVEKMESLYDEILQNLIDRHIIVREFQDKEYKLPQTVVENEFDRILTEDFNNDRASFLQHLEAQGKNVREFRKDLRERIIVSLMRREVRKNQSEISPERIESFYSENKIHFYEEEAIKLRLILLRPIANESMEVLRQDAASIIEKLENGADFAELARKHSQDSRKNRGGDWGWVKRTDLKEELSSPAFDLAEGEHSAPIEVGNQIFILYVEDKRDEGIQPISEVRDRIEEILASQISQQAQRAWLERLRKGSFVKYF